MDKQVTKEQIGSVVALLVAGKVPHDDVQAFIDKYKKVPSKKKRKKPAPRIYDLPVTYAKLPGVAALEEKFSKGGVSGLFDGRAWTRHKSCAKIDETPGERDFLVAEIPDEFLGKRIDTIEDALSEHFDRLGYRFAIEVEAVEFVHVQPELQRKNWIYALGSSALYDDGDRYVTVLDALARGRVLFGGWVGYDLLGRDRLLLVRK